LLIFGFYSHVFLKLVNRKLQVDILGPVKLWMKRKAGPFLALPVFSLNLVLIYFLKNFFLPYPARPINPEPRRSIAVG